MRFVIVEGPIFDFFIKFWYTYYRKKERSKILYLIKSLELSEEEPTTLLRTLEK